jgi:hypothetical protein
MSLHSLSHLMTCSENENEDNQVCGQQRFDKLASFKINEHKKTLPKHSGLQVAGHCDHHAHHGRDPCHDVRRPPCGTRHFLPCTGPSRDQNHPGIRPWKRMRQLEQETPKYTSQLQAAILGSKISEAPECSLPRNWHNCNSKLLVVKNLMEIKIRYS